MTHISRIRPIGRLAAAALVAGTALGGPARTQAPPPAGITSVPGIRVGHVTLSERPTGCTVILAPDGTVGGVDVRGGAPGTVETDVLDPRNSVQVINAVVLSGGSAFGLSARDGVMAYLEEQKIGYAIGGGVVPIVPGAIIYDLGIGDRTIRPGPDCGYQAAARASAGAPAEGSVGAGAGATVGKMGARGRAMKGGIGTASLTTRDGLIVGAIVAVNAVGSIVDPRTGRPVAGVRSADGRSLMNPFDLVRQNVISIAAAGENTTIGVVATNAKLTKAEAERVAIMAHDGMARAIVPSHTPSDGDTIFALGTGSFAGTGAGVGTVGALAAEAMSDAILRAVRLARGLPDYPAVSDLP